MQTSLRSQLIFGPLPPDDSSEACWARTIECGRLGLAVGVVLVGRFVVPNILTSLSKDEYAARDFFLSLGVKTPLAFTEIVAAVSLEHPLAVFEHMVGTMKSIIFRTSVVSKNRILGAACHGGNTVRGIVREWAHRFEFDAGSGPEIAWGMVPGFACLICSGVWKSMCLPLSKGRQAAGRGYH